jgi:hypothetical protein
MLSIAVIEKMKIQKNNIAKQQQGEGLTTETSNQGDDQGRNISRWIYRKQEIKRIL